MHKTDLLALYLSGTYGHKASTRSPSCYPPRQPAIDGWKGGWMDVIKKTWYHGMLGAIQKQNIEFGT